MFDHLPDPDLSSQQKNAGEAMPSCIMRSYVIRHGTAVVGDQCVAGSLKPKQDVLIRCANLRCKGLSQHQNLDLAIEAKQLVLNSVSKMFVQQEAQPAHD